MLDNGTVLEIAEDGKTHYWKITGVRTRGNPSWGSYQVVRCSKHGKEFRDTNGFQVLWIHDKINAGLIRIVSASTVGKKANIDAGIVEGVRKRRIEYLRETIAAMQSELERLERGSANA